MTVVQCTESSPKSRSSVKELPPKSEHDAPNETATMSSYGPQKDPPIASSSKTQSTKPHDRLLTDSVTHAQTQTFEPHHFNSPQLTGPNPIHTEKLEDITEAIEARRVHFGEFAEQLRQQQYFENRRHLLQQRKRVLQKTITLSARLHRVSSWIGDGLVEISEQSDATGFVRVHQHFQNLVDLSYSQWDHELHVLDPLGKSNSIIPEPAGSSDVLSKLSSSAQADLFELLSYLRSNPRFLAERFKVLTPSQIVSLWNPPRFRVFPDAAESQYSSFMQMRGRHQRIQSYSKSLEDYASSFERSNPLSFLLFNIYGTNQSSIDAENQLRLSTWSSVCAELMLTSERAYQSLILQLLDRFASLYEWRARDSVEMFLMDVLQRGSFLLNQPLDNHNNNNNNNARRQVGHDPLSTPQAQEFFDTAIQDLFAIFERYDGGFPTGALQFASAMLNRLPLVEHQMEFRGIFLFRWFIEHFLKSTISFPENENMLLKFHVSRSARQKILWQLWYTIRDRVHDVYSERPARPIDPYLQLCVEAMVAQLDSVEVPNPYTKTDRIAPETEEHTEASITISVSEIVQLLEALSPQAMHGIGSIDQLLETTAAFSASRGQYAHASERFDRLKSDLISSLEPGLSATDVHPCQEQWLQICIDPVGKPKPPQSVCPQNSILQSIEWDGLDSAQKGALRLFKDRVSDPTILNGTSYRSDILKSPSLEMLFREMSIYTSAKLDPTGCLYWNKAIRTLQEQYPLSILIKDDSAVLRNMFRNSKEAQASCRECCARIEIQLSIMEDICMKIRSTINKCVERFDSLRLKIWYSADVVPSKHYEDAKNIARALNHMATSIVRNIKSNSSSSFISSRPMSPRSTTSSMLEQPYEDIMNMMKASSAQGGPKKLADKQIELTKNWLAQTHIENFCRGEERIHRFCMEVHTVSGHLVGETLSESPVLWASDLFARERSLYDVRSFSVTSAPASTRPASIISETMSTTYRPSRPILRSADSLRMALLDDRRSTGSSRIHRDCLPPELASSIGSLSRAQSATTAESISSVFSPLPSNSRSMTSPSIYSRSASIFNDPSLSRFTETARGKAKFLEKVHQVLVCLLLSDLGCPVWSLGSETDAMLDSSRNTLAVEDRLKQRMVAETLADSMQDAKNSQTSSKHRPRSKSVSVPVTRITEGFESRLSASDGQKNERQQRLDDIHDRLLGLSELLRKLSQQVDPMEKLAIAEEFYDLSITTMKAKFPRPDCDAGDWASIHASPRRSSLDEHASRSRLQQQDSAERSEDRDVQSMRSFTAHETIQHLKSDLASLRPKTLFRDLQYISAFVPAEYTDNTSRGKALLQLGLAALAYKDEVCRSMVDVADKMLVQNPNPYSQQQLMPKITEFWMFAAREGNAVAQRELASLYLSRPEFLPVMSLPFSMPSQVFKTDMLWHQRDHRSTNTQALCLALHWMQQASANGDRLAKQKLEERMDGISIQ